VAEKGWDSERARREIARLTAPGVLGFYTHVDATAVVAFPPGQSEPANVFSILVAEEHLSNSEFEPKFLNPKRIRLKPLKDWFFGVRRYLLPIAELGPAFDRFCAAKEWRLSGELTQTADLAPIPTQFVPPDSTGAVPLNRVLKNNFRNGSHILEWADAGKTLFKQLFDDPPALRQLGEAIRPYVPIGLEGLSDRLGNIVVQLPVTVLIAKFGQMRASGDFTVTIGWHPNGTQRALRATCEKEHDHTISEFMSVATQDPEMLLPMQGGQGLHRGLVWDDQNRVLLAASGGLAFISSISLQMHVMGSDAPTRLFTMRDADGIEKEVEVALAAPTTQNIIGEPEKNPAGDWMERRIYREEAARLARERRFVQYKPLPGQERAEHERALADVRLLLNEHGKEGAWLWDPYLSAEDILSTLFYCRFPGSDLRALSAGDSPPDEARLSRNLSCAERLRACLPGWLVSKRASPPIRFADKQRAILDRTQSNFLGLRLEFRVKTGQAGWDFHDRFLIFPATRRGALAWSLGTSINGLGYRHHILQQADDGQLITEAFRELWDQLDQPHHLVWKKP
jgi:hypothetical protein